MYPNNHSLKILAGFVLSLSLASCGHNPGERAISGAGIGAGAGAVGGLLMGSPATGALIGGAAGAAEGGFTSDEQINLGNPLWK